MLITNVFYNSWEFLCPEVSLPDTEWMSYSVLVLTGMMGCREHRQPPWKQGGHKSLHCSIGPHSFTSISSSMSGLRRCTWTFLGFSEPKMRTVGYTGKDDIDGALRSPWVIISHKQSRITDLS